MKKVPAPLPVDRIDPRRNFLRLALGTGAGAVIGGGLLAACGGGDPEPQAADGRAQPLNLTTTCVPQTYSHIQSGGSAIVGTMTVSNTSTSLDLSFAAPDGCTLTNVFVWVGSDPSNVPNDSGALRVAEFPHQIVTSSPTASLSIPLSDISKPVDPCTQPLVIFAKVITSSCGFGWATGSTAYLGNPYVTYQLCGIPDCGTVLQGCETAFAYGTHVFASDAKANPAPSLPSLRLTRNRWGWAIRRTSTGTTTHNVYAGAGLNDISKGTLVGTVSINWSGTTAVVTYNLATGVVMTEAHLYAGSTPPTTIAPGQYGNNASFTTPVSSHTFTVPLAGSVAWFIVHAVVC
jgi:hypothetical protein